MRSSENFYLQQGLNLAPAALGGHLHPLATVKSLGPDCLQEQELPDEQEVQVIHMISNRSHSIDYDIMHDRSHNSTFSTDVDDPYRQTKNRFCHPRVIKIYIAMFSNHLAWNMRKYVIIFTISLHDRKTPVK
ncbi:unnamed protein product [Nesidiocoris tenuis]|uniref:Uncharacterized protein n=1 Tax=Nesidiocoris tenuis TaxID=355587 RepID=A0A6H5HTP3_9HEMI|nr:unnamed protein product [Nesidiocoris tenuis]